MMKFYKFIFISLLPIFNFAQVQNKSVVVIQYDVFYNTEIPNKKTAYLEINLKTNNAVFILSKSILESSNISKVNNDIIISGKNDVRYMKINPEENIIEYTEFLSNKTFRINDTIPKFNWVINYNEIKKIGDISCNKATLNFRGRNYVAWYDPSNPLNFGPWKFNSLPGLIMEIYDESKRYNWKVSSINYSEIPSTIPPFPDEIKTISFKEYIDLKYNQSSSTISSQMPRGVQTKILNVGRTGIETKFEWE